MLLYEIINFARVSCGSHVNTKSININPEFSNFNKLVFQKSYDHKKFQLVMNSPTKYRRITSISTLTLCGINRELVDLKQSMTKLVMHKGVINGKIT